MTEAQATAALWIVEDYLAFCRVLIMATEAGMTGVAALYEAEIQTGVSMREIATIGSRDLRAMLEKAIEQLGDVPPDRVELARRLLPGWH
jgi:hypothetical protein